MTFVSSSAMKRVIKTRVMKPEIYRNNKPTYQSYLELEPKGMNQYAPRVGYYKVIRKCRVLIPQHTLKGVFAYWKLNQEDEFDSSFETRIQLASFERNPYPGSAELLKTDLTNRIIHVKGAIKENNGTGKFIVDWEILPNNDQRAGILGKLNGLLNNPNVLDEVLSTDSLQGMDLEPDDQDY